MFDFIHCKTVKVCQNDQIQMKKWFTSVFLMNGKELRSFHHYQILIYIGYLELSRKLENWLILKFLIIHYKAVKVSQNDQIRMQTWFTIVSLMNGTELRSLVIFKFWPKSESWTLAEIFKLTNFEVCLHSL